MSKIVAIMSMSLDGFVADQNDGVAEVFDWYGNSGNVEFHTGGSDPMTFKVSPPSAEHLRALWAELGAAMPQAGGSYAFLREIYGREGAGRLVSFLYIWQLGFSAPLSIASGCIGFAEYAVYLYPPLGHTVPGMPWLHYTSLLAAGTCLLLGAVLYRKVEQVKRWGLVRWGGGVARVGGGGSIAGCAGAAR